MADFSIRSETVDVEQIMRQIRSRIREKRGVDYTEQEIRQLANAKLETFLDPTRVRSDLLEQFRRLRAQEAPPPNFAFEDTTIFETHRPALRFIRRLLRPVLKLFFNPNPIAEALHIQAKLNERNAAMLDQLQTLYYELIHNLVVEVTRLGIEVRNMKMRVDSVASRIDFSERRARALEGVVQYRPEAPHARKAAPAEAGGERTGAAGSPSQAAEQAERRKRRRRRGRRRAGEGHAGPPAAGVEPGAATETGVPAATAVESGHTDTAAAPPGSDDQS